jgi:hypothetical protein
MVEKDGDNTPESGKGHPDTRDQDLARAKTDLEAAEADLARGGERGVERAERDIARAETDLEEAEAHRHHHHHHHHEPLVTFEDVNSTETVEFRTAWDTKLTMAWDEAARLLEEPRTNQDHLQTPEGLDLTPFLDLTLRQLEERKIVTALKFQIVGPTGGA